MAINSSIGQEKFNRHMSEWASKLYTSKLHDLHIHARQELIHGGGGGAFVQASYVRESFVQGAVVLDPHNIHIFSIRASTM